MVRRPTQSSCTVPIVSATTILCGTQQAENNSKSGGSVSDTVPIQPSRSGVRVELDARS